MRKRITSLLLTLVMLLSLVPAMGVTAFAAAYPSSVTLYNQNGNPVGLGDKQYLEKNSDTTVKDNYTGSESYVARYDQSSGTLYLKGYHGVATGVYGGITAAGDLNIVVESDSSFSATGSGTNNLTAINADKLNISGSGKLTVGANGRGDVYGILADKGVTISAPMDLAVVENDTTGYGLVYGIYTKSGAISLSGGDKIIDATGGKDTVYGVYNKAETSSAANGNITIGGNLTVNLSNGNNYNRGISLQGGVITLDDATLNIPGSYRYGIYNENGNVVIKNNSIVALTSAIADGEGIHTDLGGDLTIEDSTVNVSAKGYAASLEKGKLSIKDSTVDLTMENSNCIVVNTYTNATNTIDLSGRGSVTITASGDQSGSMIGGKVSITTGTALEKGTYYDSYNNYDGEYDGSSKIVLKFVHKTTTPVTTYNLTTQVNGGHGTISASKTGLTAGSTETITFTPEVGYEIDTVTVNGVATSVSGNTLTVTMDGNKDVVVTYKAIEYNITVADGKATVGAGSGITKATVGTAVTLTANPAPDGKVFDKWEVVSGSITLADANSASTTFTMPAEAVSVKATYKNKPVTTYNLTTQVNGGHGTISASKTGLTAGSTETITFTPDAGYEIDTVTVNGTATSVSGNTLNVTMDGNKNVVVTYKAIEYNITVTDGKATVGAGSGITKATVGTAVTLTADEAPDGKVFDKWVVVSGGITLADANSATTTFTMPASAVSVKATYKNAPVTTYNLTTQVNGGHGTISASKTGLAAGSTETVIFTPDAGYEIDTVTVNGVATGVLSNVLDVTMDADKTVVVTYKAIEYNITVTDGKATIGAGSGISKAAQGTTVTLTANAAPDGKVFDKWVVESGSITLADVNSATTTFTMPASAVSVKATYKNKPVTTYSLTTQVNGGHGTISASKTGLAAGSTETVIFTPDAGYEIDTVTVNGVATGVLSNVLDVTMDADKTVIVTYKATGGGEHTHSYGTEWKYDDTNHWHECSCGDKKDTAAHTAGEWIIDTPATATTSGSKHKECTVCGYTMTTETIPATGGGEHTHSYGSDWKNDADNHWHECSCGDKADVAAHTASDWIIDTPATATTSGTKHKECTVCKRVLETGTIPATGGGEHTHSYGSDWKNDADNHWHECSCGDKADVAAHTASDWIIDTPATATTSGTKHKECTVCKRVLETGTIPATGGGEHTHSYGSDWKNDATNHWHECSCGDKADKAAHSFKWVVDKEATATKKGSKHQECKVCGYKKAAVEIPATGSTTKPSDPTQTNPSTGAESPKTGDNSNMILWIALLFVSGGAVIGITVYSKKKKENAE